MRYPPGDERNWEYDIAIVQVARSKLPLQADGAMPCGRCGAWFRPKGCSPICSDCKPCGIPGCKDPADNDGVFCHFHATDPCWEFLRHDIRYRQ